MVFVKEKRSVVGSLINQEREIDALEKDVRHMKDKDAGEDKVVEVKDKKVKVIVAKELKRKENSEEKKYLISELLMCKWS